MAKRGVPKSSLTFVERCPCINMVFSYNGEDAPSVRLKYAAELANACHLPWSAVQGCSPVKKVLGSVPADYNPGEFQHKNPYNAYREIKNMAEINSRDPLCFNPCAFCRNACANVRASGDALDAEGHEAVLIAFLIMNFDLLLSDLGNLKKSDTRDWFFSIFRMRRYYGNVYGTPPRGDILSYPVTEDIVKELYRIYDKYSSSAGNMDEELSVPVLSPAFVLRKLENSTQLFTSGLEKQHGGIAEKGTASLRDWFLSWRTAAILNKTVSPEDASKAYGILSQPRLKTGEVPPFFFDFKKEGLRSSFEDGGIEFALSGSKGSRKNEMQNAVSAENRPFEAGTPDSAEHAAAAETVPGDAEKKNVDSYNAAILEAMGTTDPAKMKTPDIAGASGGMPSKAAQKTADTPADGSPGSPGTPVEKPEEKPPARPSSATKAGGDVVKSPDIGKAIQISEEVNEAGTETQQPSKAEEKEAPDAAMSSMLDAVPAGRAGNSSQGLEKPKPAEHARREDGKTEEPEPEFVPSEDRADVEIPSFESISLPDSGETGFNKNGVMDLTGFDLQDYGCFVPDLSDWWFRILGPCDEVCVEPAEKDGDSGMLFFCHGMTAPEESKEKNRPFFISDREMSKSSGCAGFYHRIFNMGERKFYTFHKPEIINRLRSKWDYSPGQLNERIVSMQPLLVCCYDSLKLADMELLASGSEKRKDLFNGNQILNIFKAYPDLYAELYDSLISKKPEYKKQIRWYQAYEYALGTAYSVSKFCSIAETNLSRRDAVDCRFRFSRKTQINYRCLLVGLKFEASKDGEAADGDILKYVTALCIGRSFLVTQIIGTNPVLLSYRPSEAVFLIPVFGEKQEHRMKERLLNAFAAFDNAFKSTVRDLGFRITSLQNLYSFGSQILESEVPEKAEDAKAKGPEPASSDPKPCPTETEEKKEAV